MDDSIYEDRSVPVVNGVYKGIEDIGCIIMNLVDYAYAVMNECINMEGGIKNNGRVDERGIVLLHDAHERCVRKVVRTLCVKRILKP